MCFISVLVYFDYLKLFRGKDVYWQQTSVNGELKWVYCNTDKCFGNGAYGFEILKVRDDWEDYINDEEGHIRKNFESFS